MADTITKKQIKKALDLIGKAKIKSFGNKKSKIHKSGLVKKVHIYRSGT